MFILQEEVILLNMKIIYAGLESSGKSLKLAMTVSDILQRNAKWKKDSGIVRPIVSNIEFSRDFVAYAQELGVPISYWKNLDDLIKLEHADVIIDEVGNYFDSRLWADLSLDVRRWLTQGAKSGIEIYGSAQDFAQVDKSFRRLCNYLYDITKIVGSPRPSPTKPPIKRIWGVCVMKELDPRSYNEDDKKFVKSGFAVLPHIFFIQRKYCEIFDTTQKIVRSKPALLRHEDRYCEDPNCSFHKVVHI